jgi:hypothetical protein
MINGAHVVIYSKDPEADRAFFRDVLELGHVDVGGGWLIFALPPSELAVHPSDTGGKHELYLMCEDIDAFVAKMRERGMSYGELQNQPWGRLTAITLPGGGEVGVYEPHHERPS